MWWRYAATRKHWISLFVALGIDQISTKLHTELISKHKIPVIPNAWLFTGEAKWPECFVATSNDWSHRIASALLISLGLASADTVVSPSTRQNRMVSRSAKDAKGSGNSKKTMQWWCDKVQTQCRNCKTSRKLPYFHSNPGCLRHSRKRSSKDQSNMLPMWGYVLDLTYQHPKNSTVCPKVLLNRWIQVGTRSCEHIIGGNILT